MNKPLLDWLLLCYPGTPKTRAKQWITAGRVSVDGAVVRKPHQLMPDPGAGLRLLDRQATSLDPGADWQIHPRVSLLHLDGSLAVINKGPGLISVPGDTSEISALSILADFLSGRLKAPGRAVAGRSVPAAFRKLQPMSVHRLDKFTSGVFCVAMTPAARERLIEQLRAHRIRREYIAFVEGRPRTPEGIWRHWLELSRDEIRQRVLQGRPSPPSESVSEAVTRYQVIAEFHVPESKAIITKLRVQLETGRKHQIRVQAAAERLPLIGDRIYNPHYQHSKAPGAPWPFDRQALHAAALTLEHPDRPGYPLHWEAALPKDLRQLEGSLVRV